MVARKQKAKEVKGISELKSSSLPSSFIKRNQGAWRHEEWLGFLDEIRAKGYECDPDEAGLLLEQKKDEYWEKRSS